VIPIGITFAALRKSHAGPEA
jgi:hypothetical protein